METGNVASHASTGTEGALSQVRRALQAGGAVAWEAEGETRESLAVLAQRLERVQRWGGAFARIDFSPELKTRQRLNDQTLAFD